MKLFFKNLQCKNGPQIRKKGVVHSLIIFAVAKIQIFFPILSSIYALVMDFSLESHTFFYSISWPVAKTIISNNWTVHDCKSLLRQACFLEFGTEIGVALFHLMFFGKDSRYSQYISLIEIKHLGGDCSMSATGLLNLLDCKFLYRFG